MIKPRDNSFVFDLDNDPAIFLYLDPAMTAAQLENTVAHELHHVGLVACCRGPDELAEADGWPERARRVVGWVGAFGEGVAMLAAAGGPDVHPHATSPAADRERWDGDVARTAENLQELEAFFLAILNGELNETAERERAMSFFGVQGPWYTVGWVMASAIERAFGRDALLGCIEDLRTLLPTYNRAAVELGRKGEALPVWSGEMLERLAP